MSNIVKYKADTGGEISLSTDIIKRYICDNATDQECLMFMALCKAHGLNPFIREAYLIKYGDKSATVVVGKDVFTKRAFRNPKFRGMQAGIFTVDKDGNWNEREGSMVLPGETVTGAWAKVFVDGYDVPIYDSVSFEEYAGRKRDGSLNKTWEAKPGTLIRKVALVHALREAFPEELQGMYDADEMGVSGDYENTNAGYGEAEYDDGLYEEEQEF